MEDKLCLDTDFLVNFLRNKKEEVDFIVENESKSVLATTFINLFELYYGAYKSRRVENVIKLEEITHRLTLLNLSREAVKRAGTLLVVLEQQGNTIDFRDLLIGSIAQTEGFCLKTNNKKHFQKIPELIIK